MTCPAHYSQGTIKILINVGRDRIEAKLDQLQTIIVIGPQVVFQRIVKERITLVTAIAVQIGVDI